MKITVIVPAYNEAPVLGKVLSSLKRELNKINKGEIVVVDDGSTDKTAQIAKKTGVTVLSHPINRGLGGALGTGLSYAKGIQSDITVTFDADDQHSAKDIKKVIEPIQKNKADVVIGSRIEGINNRIPSDRKMVILLSNLFTKMFFNVKTTDSQSGFRAFSKMALDKMKVKTQGMEVSTELFSEIRINKLRLVEVPISIKYSEYSRSKGQSNMNALNIITRLILRLAR